VEDIQEICLGNVRMKCGTWWRIGWVDDFQPMTFNSRSSHHVGTLGKSLTHSCLWCFGVKSGTVSVLCRERLWVVVELKRRYRNIRNEGNEWIKCTGRVCSKQKLL